jgi:hypothetical protein
MGSLLLGFSDGVGERKKQDRVFRLYTYFIKATSRGKGQQCVTPGRQKMAKFAN